MAEQIAQNLPNQFIKLDELPHEVLEHIFGFLRDTKALRNLLHVSRRIREILICVLKKITCLYIKSPESAAIVRHTPNLTELHTKDWKIKESFWAVLSTLCPLLKKLGIYNRRFGPGGLDMVLMYFNKLKLESVFVVVHPGVIMGQQFFQLLVVSHPTLKEIVIHSPSLNFLDWILQPGLERMDVTSVNLKIERHDVIYLKQIVGSTLTRLKLVQGDLSDEVLTWICNDLTNLQVLKLELAAMSSAAFNEINKLTQLTHLNLYVINVDDDFEFTSISAIKNCDRLKKLTLNCLGLKVDLTDIDLLLPNLNKLELQTTYLDEKDFQCLSKHKSLTSFYLDSDFTSPENRLDVSLERLFKNPSVKMIKFEEIKFKTLKTVLEKLQPYPERTVSCTKKYGKTYIIKANMAEDKLMHCESFKYSDTPNYIRNRFYNFDEKDFDFYDMSDPSNDDEESDSEDDSHWELDDEKPFNRKSGDNQNEQEGNDETTGDQCDIAPLEGEKDVHQLCEQVQK